MEMSTGIISSFKARRFLKWYEMQIGKEYDRQDMLNNRVSIIVYNLTETEKELVNNWLAVN